MSRLRDIVSGRGRIGAAGRRAEKESVARLGAKPTPASGATDRARGDAELPDFLLEVKSTAANSMSLKFADLAEVVRDGEGAGKTGALVIVFTNGSGNVVRDGEWVAVPRWAFEELIDDS